MRITNLKSIPQLAGLSPQERNARVREAYRADKSLYVLNLLNGAAIGLCFPLAVWITEWLIGYRSLLRSVPVYLVLATVVSLLVTRALIYPRIKKALEGMSGCE